MSDQNQPPRPAPDPYAELDKVAAFAGQQMAVLNHLFAVVKPPTGRLAVEKLDGSFAVKAEEAPDPKADYKAWCEEAMMASNEAGFVGMDPAQTIRALSDLLANGQKPA
jgi:hypothetical protein